MSTHAKYAPSSAARIVACWGSANVEARYPDEDTIEKQQGDAVHWVCSEKLSGIHPQVGDVAPNGVVLNVEMIEAADMYADHIIKRDFAAWTAGAVYRVEHTFTEGPIHADNYGTPDYTMYDHWSHHIFVDDEKFGHGFVGEILNYQLINYVALAAFAFGVYNDDSLKVTMTIHQPRNYHRRGPIRSWTTTLGELRHPISELSLAYRMADDPDAPVMARDLDACKDCKGRHECEAVLMLEGPAIDLAYSSAPLVMSPAALRKERRRLIDAEKVIKLRREGIEQSLMSTIQRGGIVPYFSIQHKKGRTVWKDDAVKDMQDIASAYSVPISTPKLSLTPLQAIKAGIPEEVVSMYSHAPGGAAELVEDDGTAAEQIFNKD
jgi:hypothetical protein